MGEAGGGGREAYANWSLRHELQEKFNARWRATTLSTRPMPNMKVNSEDPPALMKGSGSPVTGSSEIFMPTFTMVCRAIITATPYAISEPNVSCESWAARTQRQITKKITPSTASAPTMPNSAAIAEKMKSL